MLLYYYNGYSTVEEVHIADVIEDHFDLIALLKLTFD